MNVSRRGLTPSLPVILSIARVSFFEILREKILYITLMMTALLMFLGFAASRLFFIRPDRVILDFGLSAVNISMSILAILIAGYQIGREVDRRTIHIALVRPISRGQFLLGKFAGIKCILILNWLLLSAGYVVILGLSSHEGFTEHLHATLFWALGLLLFQSVVLAAVGIFLSTFTTAALSWMICTGFYLIGNNISQIRLLAIKTKNVFVAGSLNGLTWIFPNLEHFSLGTQVTYGLPIVTEAAVTAIVYSAVYSALVLLLAVLSVQKRELN
ncbi:MAG: ABC transporter permease [Bdellovibrionales bacterium]|nr:ABC transporter permease [Bdellovibrionales bacterium]